MVKKKLVMRLTVIIELIVVEIDNLSIVGIFISFLDLSVGVVFSIGFQFCVADTIPGMVRLFFAAEGNELNRSILSVLASW